jgi:hypothetical protein
MLYALLLYASLLEVRKLQTLLPTGGIGDWKLSDGGADLKWRVAVQLALGGLDCPFLAVRWVGSPLLVLLRHGPPFFLLLNWLLPSSRVRSLFLGFLLQRLGCDVMDVLDIGPAPIS